MCNAACSFGAIIIISGVMETLEVIQRFLNRFVGWTMLLVMWLWLEEQVPVILLWAPGIGLCPLSHIYEQVLVCSTFGHMDSYVHRYQLVRSSEGWARRFPSGWRCFYICNEI